MVADYSCKNFEHELENKEYFLDNVLYRHPTLPLGEFAIGTNTTAYVAAKKYNIADKMPILIAEKMGPHFAVGDTCYSLSLIHIYAVNIPIIGMGGIASAEDAIEFILAGASAVSVGTANFHNPAVTMEVIDGIEAYMKKNGFENVADMVGIVE